MAHSSSAVSWCGASVKPPTRGMTAAKLIAVDRQMMNHQPPHDGADGHSGQHQDREEVAQRPAPRSSEDRADGPDDQSPGGVRTLRLEADAGNIPPEEASAKQGYSQSDVAPRDGRHQAWVSNIALMVRERHGAAFSTFRWTNGGTARSSRLVPR